MELLKERNTWLQVIKVLQQPGTQDSGSWSGHMMGYGLPQLSACHLRHFCHNKAPVPTALPTVTTTGHLYQLHCCPPA